MSKIAILGSGNVGSALQRGLSGKRHETRTSTRIDAREVAEWGDVVILAVPFGALDEVVRETAGALDGKPVVDVTNALTKDMRLALGYTTSGAEELQKKLPAAAVVKCFNTVFAEHMDSGRLDGHPLTAFAASDDEEARDTVLRLASDIGFDAIDAGPLENARWLEVLGYFNIQLGYSLGLGKRIGLHLVREDSLVRGGR